MESKGRKMEKIENGGKKWREKKRSDFPLVGMEREKK